ncbi:MAG: hypothetical protein AAF989_02400 [Planctomycetota bacterium]
MNAIEVVEQWISDAGVALWRADLTRVFLAIAGWIGGVWLIWLVVDHWLMPGTERVRLGAWAIWVAGPCFLGIRQGLPLLRHRVDPAYAAQSIERDLPELRQSLTTYVAMRDDANSQGLRGAIVRGVASTSAKRLREHDALPQEATGLLSAWGAVLLLFMTVVVYWAVVQKSSWQSTQRLLLPWASIESPTRVQFRNLLPVSGTVLAGREIEISVDVSRLRDEEKVWARLSSNFGESDVELLHSSDEGFEGQTFVGSFLVDAALNGELFLHVEAGDASTETRRLTIRDVPVVRMQSISYEPPAHTGLPRRVSKSGAIRAIEGTRVTINASCPRPIRRAVLEFNPKRVGDEIVPTAGAVEMEIGDRISHAMTLRGPSPNRGGSSRSVAPTSYRVKVWDAEGQTNPDPIIHPIEVLKDLPPDVAIVVPQQTPKEVPIDAEQVVEVHATDPDFGLHQVRLEISRRSQVFENVVLIQAGPAASDAAGAIDPAFGVSGNQIGAYGFRPRRLGLRVGDVVEVVAVAIDNRFDREDSTLRPNVTKSDSVVFQVVDDAPTEEVGDGLHQPDQFDPNSDPVTSPDQADPANSDINDGGGAGEEAGAGSGGNGSGDEGSTESGADNSGAGNSDAGGTGQGESEETSEDAGGAGGGGDSANQTGGDPSGSGGSGGDSSSGGGDNGAAPDGNETTSEGNNTDNVGAQQGTGNSGSSSTGGEPGDLQAGQGDESGTETSPPQHDGEAFERIRDHLEDQKRSGQPSGGEPQDDTGGTASSDAGEASAQDRSPDPSPNGTEGNPSTDGADSTDGAGDSSAGDPAGRDALNPGDASANGESDSGPSKDGMKSGPSPGDGLDGENQGTSDQKSDGAGSRGKPVDESADPNETDGGSPSGTPSGKPVGDDDRTVQGSPDSNGIGVSNSDEGSNTGESLPEGSGNAGTSESENATPGRASDPSNEGQASSGRAEDAGMNTQSAKGDPSSVDNPGSKGGSDSKDASPSSSGASTNGDASSRNDGNPTSADDDTPNRSGGGSQDAAVGNRSATDGDGDRGPDPVDVDYAKKATDMVLDYLEETRDRPDSELLEKLNWTPQDLERFRDRWDRLRDIATESQDVEDRRDFDDALRSLGLREKSSRSRSSTNSGDAGLRPGDAGTRDSGNRSRPPAAFREAFEAFRRGVGRGVGR